MTTLKKRFGAKFPLADYEAVYARLMRDNKSDFEKALNLEKEGTPQYPFSYLEKADKTCLGHEVPIRLLSNFDSSYSIGFDKEHNLFYIYKPIIVFQYPTLDCYVDTLIERLIA